ncbi:MAG: hypothetical protein O3B76_01985 [Proteobacteria bacterium]|nr:hypothetical protein [Pseudomonadota bacterium]MDA1023030.1 hypothetical protein [Pseudomonadota bacterium]
MKNLFIFAAVILLVLFVAPLTGSPVLADQSLAKVGEDIKDGLAEKSLCADKKEDRTADTTVSQSDDPYLLSDLSGSSRAPVYVTCSSSEWCCKHDFSTGQCSSCCTK